MLVTKEEISITGDLAFSKKVEMQFDPAARNMQVRNAIRMYANPRLAALREYTSNARDAHKAAGYDGPVEVTLPSALHPFLTIVDKGVGLSSEELEGFGQFGHTTKDGSNEYIGGFGLGSKSGLAVANQFTVISVKGGKKNVVVVGWDETGAPSLGFLEEQDTKETNGVTIQIPSETGHGDWANIAQGHTFIGWERGSILVNGKEPVQSVHDATQFKPIAGGWLTLAERKGRSYYGPEFVHALVHGVYYSIPVDKLGSRKTTKVLDGSVLKIENGAVDILPSRDDLEWTDRTIREVRRVADIMVQAVVAEYAAQIAKVKTFKEAKKIEAAMEAIDLPTAGMHFKGVLLDWSREGDHKITRGKVKTSTTAKSGWQNDRTATQTRNATDVHNEYAILVTGCSGTTATGYHRKDQRFVTESSDVTAFVCAEMASSGENYQNVIVYMSHEQKSDLPQGFVLAMTKVMSLEDFQAQAVAQRKTWAADRAKAGAGTRVPQSDRILRTVGSYNSYGYNFYLNERAEKDIIASTNNVVVLHNEDALSGTVMTAHTDGTSSLGMRALMQYIATQAVATNTTFVVLAKNHKAENLVIPSWKPLSVWLRESLTTVKISTPVELATDAYKASRRYQSVLSSLSSSEIAQIKDDNLREWMTAYVNNGNPTLQVSVARAFPTYAPAQPEASDYSPLDHYPLIEKLALRSDEGQLLVDYVNMVDSTR